MESPTSMAVIGLRDNWSSSPLDKGNEKHSCVRAAQVTRQLLSATCVFFSALVL